MHANPADLARQLEVSAPGFIITLYGDVVLPRGGVLAMASLIDCCAMAGFGENQVRTAVSRLVGAGRLAGERRGRRSFYRLTDAARDEFQHAAALIYRPDARPSGWWLLRLDQDPTEDQRRAHHLAPVGGGCWLAPDGGSFPAGAMPVMRAPADDPGLVPGIAGFWDLEGVAVRYARLLRVFSDLPQGPQPLAERLLLVHGWRAARLRDPLLPDALLPADWAGRRAQDLFRDRYLRLCPGAEAQIASLDGGDGPLPAQSADSRSRQAALS
ncbi:PaaX family transcriptional regulator C-terminal domain-containing protein [Paracoccus aestuarii]|nr:PaaX family transcriptional regulator C-terminal domain-containing protein [Paracoccus aestuarii]WCR01146.1 PaaX family transcriptional regulator [Paracoccus aestuarii]